MTDRFISLREYLETLLREYDLRYQQRFEASQESIKAALEAAKEAVSKAEVAVEKRFDNTNEWRQTFDDLAQGKLGRAEYLTAHKGLEDKIGALEKRMDLAEGKTIGTSGVVALVIAIAGVLVGAMIALWNVFHR